MGENAHKRSLSTVFTVEFDVFFKYILLNELILD